MKDFLSEPEVRDGCELFFERLIDAPRELVWKAWTDPGHIAQWWGPNGFTTTTKHMDLKPGGNWIFTMHGPDGRDYPNKITYEEVIEHELMVYSHVDDDDTEDISFHVRVTFEDVDGKTRLQMHQRFPSEEELRRVVEQFGALEGARQTLARLDEYVLANTDSMDDLVIERIFDAPRDLVWKAWTEIDRMKQWWGPKTFTAPAIKADVREGGKYHFCMRSPDGKDYWSAGKFLEVKSPKRLVLTDAFADAVGNIVPASYYGMEGDWPLEMQVTVTFEEVAGKTRMTLRHKGLPAGIIHDQTGHGWNESFDKLAALVE